jgi:hypothetical protein
LRNNRDTEKNKYIIRMITSLNEMLNDMWKKIKKIEMVLEGDIEWKR